MALTTSMSIKIQDLINKINQVVNINSTNLIDAVNILIDKYNEIAPIIEVIAGELGTINNPIAYNGNIKLEANKYYLQENQLYLCTKSSDGNVYHPLIELINTYVQKIEG